MSFPAFFAFEDDERPTSTVRRVYRHLRKYELEIDQAHAVKLSTIATALRMPRNRLGHAVQWLIDHGYVLDRGHDGKLRKLTLAFKAPTNKSVPMSHAS